jgi:hypothetical protein
MKLHRLGPALVLAMLLPAPALRAEDPPSVQVGSRVRLRAPGILPGALTGTVIAEDEQALTLKIDGESLRVPLAEIGALEVSAGRRRQWKKGMLVGAAVEATIFAVSARGTPRCRNGSSCLAPPPGLAFGALLGALHGGAVGALVRADRWERVPAERTRVSVVPTLDRGIGLSLAVRF